MQSEQIREGATVRSTDGEKLGKIVSCQDDGFIIEKGVFFKKDYIVRYDDVIDTRDGEVILAMDMEALRADEVSEEDVGGPSTREVETRDLDTSAAGGKIESASEDVRVPITEEKLDVDKRNVESGAVKVKKDVVTEQKTVNVPVQREVVSVETQPASGTTTSPAEGAFQEKDITIPVHEEEVEVHKRPVTKEEVHISKGVEQAERQVSDTVRKEKAKVETEGDVKKTDKPTPRDYSHP